MPDFPMVNAKNLWPTKQNISDSVLGFSLPVGIIRLCTFVFLPPETFYLLASFFLAPGPYLAFVPEMICFMAIQVVGACLFLPKRS